ncbi:Hypp8243 [Branchiostoma lanceolatum]|uniref:Hypp8243 protein n=1 Tax=Branchiostoma lanceolatum TaxID=7740 RepID=A0A8K0EF42_BRALA|nr:Hypp8243 [Branchiostoma lanceolatum]
MLSSSPIKKVIELDDHNSSFMTISSGTTIQGEKDISYILSDNESPSGSEEEAGRSSGESDEDSIDVEEITLGSYYISTDSNSSQAMERDAFGVGLDYLISEGVDIECIATDRHKGIRAELKKPAYRRINHQFDLFHVSKSIKKKLGLRAKKRCKKDISPWINCISNHLWWSSRTCGGDDVVGRKSYN